MVARAALDAGDARRIHDRTQGNPLFIGETVRASIEDGSLELRDGRMVLVEPSAPRLPLTLRAVLGARLDALDEPARDVLSVASVIGIGFDLAELEGPPGRADPARVARPARGRCAHRPGRSRRDLALQPPTRARGRLCRDAGVTPPAAPRPPRRPARGDACRSRSKHSPSIARPPGMPRRLSRCLSKPRRAALAVGAPYEAAAFWRNAAELATTPEDIERFRAAADAAVVAAKG